MNIKLISLDQTKLILKVDFSEQKSEKNKIFIGQNLWHNQKIVGKIVKINLKSEIDSEIESKIIRIECLGNFENFGWKGDWKFGREYLLSPLIWQLDKDQNSENNENPQTNLQTKNQQKNTQDTQTESQIKQISSKFKTENQTKQVQKYYFIPTVQKFETVKSGQKLGFIEMNGNLYWLICPNFEKEYQAQIESGEFESDEKIGILIGKNSEYDLTLEQSLNFDFELSPQKSNHIISCGIPLFDLFCPFVIGNKTILQNFDQNQIAKMLTSLSKGYQKKPIIITDFELFDPDLYIFKTENWYELSKYFALCGNDMIVVLENLPCNFGQYLDLFGTFGTISGESCSISLFLVEEKPEKNSKNKEIANLEQYFETCWKLIEIKSKSEIKTLKKNLPDYQNSNWKDNLDKNSKSNSSINSNSEINSNVQFLPDILNSFGIADFKKFLLDNLREQNSPFVNNGNKNSVNLKLKLELEDLQNPFFSFVLGQNTQSLEQSVVLWELFGFLKHKFEDKLANLQGWKSEKNFLAKITENSQTLTKIITKTFQNGQNIHETKAEIVKLLE